MLQQYIYFFFLLVYTTITFLHAESGFNSIQSQISNDKIAVAGFDDMLGSRAFLVARYNPDGSLDTSFNNTGFIVTPIGFFASAHAVRVQPSDEKIIAGGLAFTGASIGALTRYLSTGPLDPTFGGDGIVTTLTGQGVQINSIALQNNEQIVACGSTIANGASEIFLARYNTNGTLDTSFGTSGIVTTSIGNRSSAVSIAIQPEDEKIVITARVDDDSFAIARYNTNGTLDTSFGTSGITRTILGNNSNPSDIAIQGSGLFIISGHSGGHIALARYTATGTLDASFGNTGIVTTQIGQTSTAHSITINPDNSFVIGGSSDNKTLNIKYNPNGSIDTIFGDNGIVVLNLEKDAHISDTIINPSTTGIISAGHLSGKGLIAQLTATGTLDCNFNHNGIVTFPENPLFEPNFLFAFSTSTQSVGTTFSNITFDTNGPISNWSHTPGNSIFTCQESGAYLIVYNGVYTETSLITLSSVSIIALLNGVEAIGTQIGTNLSVGMGSTTITRTMILNVCKNDQLQIQHRRSAGDGTISLEPVGFGTTPIGGSISIHRLA